MLTYLYQVTEDLLIVAILSGFVFAYAWQAWDRPGRRIVGAGCLAGWLGAVVLAYLKNATKLVDSGLWNLRFVGAYLVGLVLFVVPLVPPVMRWLEARGGKRGALPQQVGLALVLLGAIGYMAPEPLGYPVAIVNAVSTLVSTDFFFRLVGWVLGLLLMLLVTYGLFKVLCALGGRIVDAVCVFGAAFVGAVLGGLAMRALLTRRIIPQSKPAFRVAVFASNNNLLFCCVMAAVAVACVGLLLARSLHVSEPYRNPAQHRKIRAKWRSRRRWASVTCACLMLALVSITAIKAYDSREVELSPSEDFELRDDGCYVSLDQVSDGHLHRFTYESPDGVGIRFIIIKKPGGNSYGIGLDACDICGETGYYERDGNQVVCKLCDVVMNVQTIGFKGGCNPIVIDYDIADGYIHVPFDTLLEHEAIFTR